MPPVRFPGCPARQKEPSETAAAAVVHAESVAAVSVVAVAAAAVPVVRAESAAVTAESPAAVAVAVDPGQAVPLRIRFPHPRVQLARSDSTGEVCACEEQLEHRLQLAPPRVCQRGLVHPSDNLPAAVAPVCGAEAVPIRSHHPWHQYLKALLRLQT